MNKLFNILGFICLSLILLLIPLVSADSYNYTVAVGSDDRYHWSNSDGDSGTIDDTTTLLSEDNWAFSPRKMAYTEININTSAIPDDDVISSAKFYFYIDSYTSTRGTARTFYVLIETDTVVIGSTHVSNGWYSFDIPSGSLSEINKTGKTKFIIGVTEIAPGGTTFRTMYVRAYEYTGDFTSYLTVTHAPPIEVSETYVLEKERPYPFLLIFSSMLFIAITTKNDTKKK